MISPTIRIALRTTAAARLGEERKLGDMPCIVLWGYVPVIIYHLLRQTASSRERGASMTNSSSSITESSVEERGERNENGCQRGSDESADRYRRG